jgi:hypothetical protein
VIPRFFDVIALRVEASLGVSAVDPTGAAKISVS